MRRTKIIKAILSAALCLAPVLLFSGCGEPEEVDRYATEVVKLTITPVPTPTPEPVAKYPAATVSKNGITMVNIFLADAEDGKNIYAGKAAQINAQPDEPEEESTENTEGAISAEETSQESSGNDGSSGISSYYEDSSGESDSYDYDYNSGYDYDSGNDYNYDYDYNSGYGYDYGYDYDAGY